MCSPVIFVPHFSHAVTLVLVKGLKHGQFGFAGWARILRVQSWLTNSNNTRDSVLTARGIKPGARYTRGCISASGLGAQSGLQFSYFDAALPGACIPHRFRASQPAKPLHSRSFACRCCLKHVACCHDRPSKKRIQVSIMSGG